MTHADEGYRSDPSILAIGKLSVHRETLRQLTGARLAGELERNPTRNCTRKTCVLCTYRCTLTCGGHCGSSNQAI